LSAFSALSWGGYSLRRDAPNGAKCDGLAFFVIDPITVQRRPKCLGLEQAPYLVVVQHDAGIFAFTTP
jgi:hypothetical protein